MNNDPVNPEPNPTPKQAGLLRALARRCRASRRGTIIVLALGVLAILAISAVSYVAIVRIDRTAVVSARREINVQEQVNIVRDHIGSLIAADIFGNKVVTRDTPTRAWPSAFEDGEFTDRPHVEGEWAVAPLNSANSEMRLGAAALPIARPDDAWLASTEPVIDESAFLNSYWPQITNLRSAWRYQPQSGARPEQWKRDDGQYADLMQFFLQPTPSGNANPAAILSRDQLAGIDNAFGPTLGTAFRTIPGGTQPIDQRGPLSVFGTQMNRVQNSLSNIASVANDQERFWTDTDGDLRPDARWQQLEALGTAYGLTWVVAARVIDASSLINFNTSLSFPYRTLLGSAPLRSDRTWADVVATGETPADIDLIRFLGYAAPPASQPPATPNLSDLFGLELSTAGAVWPTPVRTDRLLDLTQRPTLRQHIGVTLGFGPTMRNLSQPPKAVNDPDYNPPYEPRLNAARSPATRFPEQEYPVGFENDPSGWSGMDFPTASQRAVWYGLLNADETSLAPRSVQPLTIRDFADLHAFRATNNTEVVGKLEQGIDGTEQNGFLPGGGTTNTPYGPLRSREGTDGSNANVADSPRFFGSPDQDDTALTPGRPTLRQLKWDNRHLLTPVNGVGRVGPVPVLNTPTYETTSGSRGVDQPSYFDGLRALDKINIPQLERDTQGPLSREIVQRVLDAFVWALAPLATDKPLSAELARGGLFAGGAADPITTAAHYGGGTSGNGPADALNTDVGALATEAANYAVLKSLCLTANLIDALGGVSNTLEREAPTVLRFFNDNTGRLPVTAGIPSLGTRLAQGSIPPAKLSNEIFGNPGAGGTVSSATGVTVFGVDRQPFLVQASYYAFYEDSDAIPAGAQTVTIEPNDPSNKDQLGSIIAFEIRNPWPQFIDLANYKILLKNYAVASRPQIEFDLGALASGVPALPAGGSVVLFYRKGPLNSAPAEMRDFWDQTGTGNDILDHFQTMVSGASAAPVLLEIADTGVTARTEAVEDTLDAPVNGAGIVPPVFADYLLGGTGVNAPVKTIPVLLIRKGSTQQPDAVVDRLSPPIGGTAEENFPNVLTTDYTHSFAVNPGPQTLPGPVLVNPVGRARVAVASTVYRPSAQPAAGGVPPYIVERREANKLQILPLEPSGYTAGGVTINRRQVWVTGSTPAGLTADPEPTASDLVLGGNGVEGDSGAATWKSLGVLDKGPLTVGGTQFPFPLQLFNPAPGWVPVNEGDPLPDTGPPAPAIRSAADILLLPSVAHLYINGVLTPPVDAYRHAADLTRTYSTASPNTVAFAARINESPARSAWVTASEMLGSDWELYRDPVAGGTNFNRYAGVLDPSRFNLADQLAGQSQNLPDALSIPLALRVMDAFDGLDHRSELAQGRVNLNTAPARVLTALPFLSPLTAIDNADDADGDIIAAPPSLPAPTLPDPLRYPLLGDWLLPYRSLNLENPASPGSAITADWRATSTSIASLRRRNAQPREFGLVSVGELAVMGQFDPLDGSPAGAPGAPIAQNGFLHVGNNTTTERGVPFGRLGNPDSQTVSAYRVTDGIEEQHALLRALGNVTAARSDVFIAYFTLRGYDPDEIESIQVNNTGATPTFDEARAAMLNERFRPRVESRWLVVYDRSQVKVPTDRPRVLVQMELPSAKP